MDFELIPTPYETGIVLLLCAAIAGISLRSVTVGSVSVGLAVGWMLFGIATLIFIVYLVFTVLHGERSASKW